MTEIVISFFVLVGALFMLLGAVAIIRLPDTYTRINAATKASTLGVIGIMIGLFLFFIYIHGSVSGKILLTIIFVFITAPISGFMMARSAYHAGIPIWKQSVRDDLKKAMIEKEK
ncbi:Na+/H+ antiporter subunit G [Paraliobacillus quinghaiensis]|uniref:Na+/H+ antiporter subunit G n=1 Tax=Paraliobacillus quinghaiensis TaxID=470815 RepID=A0A917TDZ5_9BACI|nr:monovalent cation/H(+) antiporter subunit G [Paraliobacillus quinghaiensis]GGM19208.1 Na+/H+ antiporter subunit G [Paraliobacillus quinghaiensis]